MQSVPVDCGIIKIQAVMAQRETIQVVALYECNSVLMHYFSWVSEMSPDLSHPSFHSVKAANFHILYVR